MDPFVYQYAVGSILFTLGLVYAWRQGYVGLSGRGLRNLVVAVGGLAVFAVVQGYLQYAPMTEAAAVPYSGPGLPEGVLGTPLDYGIMIGYFVAMLAVGTWFGRNQTTTRDFFFGGQRFSWWLIAFSLIATTIGSYSFVKYSAIAYTWGLASTQTYLNDWFWIPFLLFGWVPILYFSRVMSIPEYFARRFNPTARKVSTVLLLVYLIGYVGINLFTMGQALHILLGWPILASAALVATISAIYVTFGGQTSVIMTDLFQGLMLIATGLLILVLGVLYLGGWDVFWEHLPRAHRLAFSPFNEDPSFPAVGIYWQDGVANSAMFYFLNQGMVMRLMAARTVEDSRKAMVVMLLVLMPLAAVVVASGGWVGQALVHAGHLPELPPKEAFFITAEFLSRPGVFGLVMAALTAALMSTVDTLITAIAAIVVNDVYQPLRPAASDKELMRVARWSSVSITLLGVGLVPVFMSFGSIYSAHGAFTAAITPPLVVALLLGVFWRRFTPAAAVATMVGGSAVIFLSILAPVLVTPFAHGVPMVDVEPGFLAGKDQYKFMRALFGLFSCGVIGVTVTLFTTARPLDSVRGLVWGTVSDAIAHYKGSPGSESESAWAPAEARGREDDARQGHLPVVHLSASLAAALEAGPQDLIYLSDRRAWLGGLRSSHAIVGEVLDEPGDKVVVGASLFAMLVQGRERVPLRVKRLY
ncbi:MAG: sodium/solute symporter [Deltaproteobacteria bacterium]|nr:sodium/solute symporter [Deltaproteobacteria bacterium]